jgi:hypothetical protein
LIANFLGLTIPADADVSVAPHINGYGSVEFGIPLYGLRYSNDENGFALKNLSDKRRRYKVDLSALHPGTEHYRLTSKSSSGMVGAHCTLTLSPQEEARWTPES